MSALSGAGSIVVRSVVDAAGSKGFDACNVTATLMSVKDEGGGGETQGEEGRVDGEPDLECALAWKHRRRGIDFTQ